MKELRDPKRAFSECIRTSGNIARKVVEMLRWAWFFEYRFCTSWKQTGIWGIARQRRIKQ
jgi:hypothetical protein